MIYNERNIRKEIVLEAAKQIMMAARTAPKGKGGYYRNNYTLAR